MDNIQSAKTGSVVVTAAFVLAAIASVGVSGSAGGASFNDDVIAGTLSGTYEISGTAYIPAGDTVVFEPGTSVIADNIVVEGDLVATDESQMDGVDLLLWGKLSLLVEGSIIGADGAHAARLTSGGAGEDGHDGSTLVLASDELDLSQGYVYAGAGGNGGDIVNCRDSGPATLTGGDGGDAGFIFLMAEDPVLPGPDAEEGALYTREGGEGGPTATCPGDATTKSIGGDGGNGGSIWSKKGLREIMDPGQDPGDVVDIIETSYDPDKGFDKTPGVLPGSDATITTCLATDASDTSIMITSHPKVNVDYAASSGDAALIVDPCDVTNDRGSGFCDGANGASEHQAGANGGPGSDGANKGSDGPITGGEGDSGGSGGNGDDAHAEGGAGGDATCALGDGGDGGDATAEGGDGGPGGDGRQGGVGGAFGGKGGNGGCGGKGGSATARGGQGGQGGFFGKPGKPGETTPIPGDGGAGGTGGSGGYGPLSQGPPGAPGCGGGSGGADTGTASGLVQ